MAVANAGYSGGVAFSEAWPPWRGHRLRWELPEGTTGGHLPDFSDLTGLLGGRL